MPPSASPSLALAIPAGFDTARPPSDAAAPAAIGPWQDFSRPLAEQAGHWESYLAIGGMHCAACTLLVEQALSGVPDVVSVQVNGAAQTARVVWAGEQPRLREWVAALARAGYDAGPSDDLLDERARVKAGRTMLWRWLVAGFCMMQAMMYALPLYVAAPGEITPDIEALLRWAAWTMTLPVMLFSCRPFFASALRDLRHRRIGMDVPVALGILIAFLASTAATFEPTGPWGREVWYDSVTMFVFFLLSGRLLEARLRDRAAGALQALTRALPASVEREGEPGVFERVPVRCLRVGDRIRLVPGERIPVDGRIEAGSCRVDEALLTGESEPASRTVGQPVIAGSHNLDGTLQVRVERVGADTRFAGIVALMARAAMDKPRLAQLADRLAAPFLVVVVLAAAVAVAGWWSAGAAHALSVGVAVLIVTCPCALSLATPAALLAAAGSLARRGVLVRELSALDAVARIDAVLFDKTGTLTREAMGLVRTRTRAGADAAQALALGAALARGSLHPLSRALAAAGPSAVPTVEEGREHAGLGVTGRVGGEAVRLGAASFCGAPATGATADGPVVHLADAKGWLASFEFDETLRPGAAQAVAALRAQGVEVRLLSGDREEPVARMAQRLGIAHWRAGCSPEDKLAHLLALQAQGRRVLMVGDGMNDGPVLARADASVAMAQGVPLAQAQSDFIVQGGQLSALPRLLAQARRCRRVVRQNIAWAAAYNAACVPLAIAGFMPAWLAGLGMACSSLLVVANAARLAHIPTER